jgi:hypothetical protein
VNNKQLHHRHQRLKEKQTNPEDVTDPLKKRKGKKLFIAFVYTPLYLVRSPLTIGLQANQ